jgi:alpha-glucosidase (family GH31 glycosyl hydrolase)
VGGYASESSSSGSSPRTPSKWNTAGFVHYPEDPEVYGLEYQFMVGEELMVAPVLNPGEGAVEVYLPAGRWVRLWSDKEYGTLEGGVYETVPAPVGSPPSSTKRARRRGAT